MDVVKRFSMGLIDVKDIAKIFENKDIVEFLKFLDSLDPKTFSKKESALRSVCYRLLIGEDKATKVFSYLMQNNRGIESATRCYQHIQKLNN